MATLWGCFCVRFGRELLSSQWLRFRGCRSVLGPSGLRLRCRVWGEPVFSDLSTLLIAVPPQLNVCRSSDCGLCLANDCHRFYCVLLQSFCSFDRLHEQESNRQQLGIEYLQTSSGQITAGDPAFSVMLPYCCCSHSAVIRVWPVCPPHPESRPDFRFLLSCPALRGALGCDVIM